MNGDYVIEVAIDASRSGFFERLGHVDGFIVEGSIETQFVDQPLDLVVGAGVTDDVTTCRHPSLDYVKFFAVETS